MPRRSPTCRRKIKHASRDAAYRHLRELLRAEYCEDGKSLNVYRCGECGHYHVGHKPPKLRIRNQTR